MSSTLPWTRTTRIRQTMPSRNSSQVSDYRRTTFQGVMSKVTFGQLWYFIKLYFWIFCVILPIFTFRLKFSIYYWGESVIHLNHLNNARVANARLRIDKERTSENSKLSSDSWKSRGLERGVLITVISMKRDTIQGYDPKYLSQTITELIDLMRRFQRDSGDPKFFGLALCNIDPHPRDYAELNELSEVYKIHTFTRFSESRPSESEKTNRHLKERNDYSYCLRKSLEAMPRYVLMLEDDAVPLQDALWIIHDTIKNSLERFHENKPEELGFVKFYHPTLWHVWSIFWQHLGLSAFLGTILTVFHHCVTRGKSALHFNWFFYTLLVLLACLAIGQGNILKMRRLSAHLYTIVPSYFFSMPAVLFSNSSGYLFADYNDNHQCHINDHCPKDLVLGPFVKDTGTRGLMVQPNIFDHIGLISIVNRMTKHPNFVD
ncbi:post-GPI attachment to proteins factor 4-like [Lineus longissimus]|uniref:post-GPI attachment to proteins factor 4-like n=1 Tax=Lineus longissimus TaxID=88925 RepID=UPI002B4E4B65